MNNIKLIIILIYLFTAAGMPDASARKKKNKQSAKTEEKCLKIRETVQR